jgi:hypothetical protein
MRNEKGQFIKGMSSWNKGKKMTYKHGMFGKKHTLETRKKMSESQQGHIAWNSGMALGLYGTRFYKIWQNMKTRCYNSKTIDYSRYGGRGIIVCKEWKTFQGFHKDMFFSYKTELTLDRIDNNKGYSKENCRWATRKEQAQNTRNIDGAKKYTFNGITKTIREWAEKIGIKRTTLSNRLQSHNWNIEKALTFGGNFYE